MPGKPMRFSYIQGVIVTYAGLLWVGIVLPYIMDYADQLKDEAKAQAESFAARTGL
jgi:hypothetical protein